MSEIISISVHAQGGKRIKGIHGSCCIIFDLKNFYLKIPEKVCHIRIYWGLLGQIGKDFTMYAGGVNEIYAKNHADD